MPATTLARASFSAQKGALINLQFSSVIVYTIGDPIDVGPIEGVIALALPERKLKVRVTDGPRSLPSLLARGSAVSVNPPVPSITSLTPNTIASGRPSDLPVTVAGTNYVNGSVVLVNGSSVATTFVSATQLTAIVTPNFFASAGLLTFTVRNPDTQLSGTSTFTVT